jgi:hypothetical protein
MPRQKISPEQREAAAKMRRLRTLSRYYAEISDRKLVVIIFEATEKLAAKPDDARTLDTWAPMLDIARSTLGNRRRELMVTA